MFKTLEHLPYLKQQTVHLALFGSTRYYSAWYCRGLCIVVQDNAVPGKTFRSKMHCTKHCNIRFSIPDTGIAVKGITVPGYIV